MKWNGLHMTDSDGQSGPIDAGTIAQYAELDEDDSLRAVHSFFIHAPGGTPSWETPGQLVDWSGFAETIRAERKK